MVWLMPCMKHSAPAFRTTSNPSLHTFKNSPRRETKVLVTMQDVDEVYRTVLLGSSEDNDLFHYQTRLKEGLNDENSYTIALEILAETATQGTFTPEARRCLARLHSPDEGDVPGRIADVLDVLIHDGYLQDGENGYHFPFRLLRDWWSNRFRDQHTPLAQRFADEDGGLQ